MAVSKKTSCNFLAVVLIVNVISQDLLATATPYTVPSGGGNKREYDDSWMHPATQNRNPVKYSPGYVNEDKAFWYKDAQAKLLTKISQENLEAEAKNTILFLGDGMSIPTVTASRIFKGQAEELPNGGEEAQLSFDDFPHSALSKTYCTDSQVADSACSATAYLCGTKANIGTIGVSNRVLRKDCRAQRNPANQVSSILAWAQAAGKSTGIVTTARVTHASPAGAYAHIADRDWENDFQIYADSVDPKQCDDIAEQLILNEPGCKINVILGGGRRNFFNESIPDPETGNGGYRGDGKNLVATWLQNKKRSKYITCADELKAVDCSNTDYLLGLFSADHMGYKDEAEADKDPTLEEMTAVAIKILSRNPNGYFLFVEGGRIDHAHHNGQAQRALVETVEFDKAITCADKLTNDEDTLIVVTSDHAHVMSINGYPERGNPLLGVSDYGKDGLPYTTLSYANGPGYREPTLNRQTKKCVRADVTADDFYNILYQQVSMVPIEAETHGGDDVGIFAKGPWAHLFSGVLQQSYIPHAMAYAACIGNGAKFCKSHYAKRETI